MIEKSARIRAGTGEFRAPEKKRKRMRGERKAGRRENGEAGRARRRGGRVSKGFGKI
jgi:hypothetical protein